MDAAAVCMPWGMAATRDSVVREWGDHGSDCLGGGFEEEVRVVLVTA